MQKSDVKVSKKVITPEMAQEYLKKNTHNRPLNERKVQEYYKDMKNGEWYLTTDAIGFDVEGKMNNGQHRMHALVLYGKPVEFLVATNFEQEVFNYIDTGKVRNAGDVLGANGLAAGHHKSAIIKFVYGYKKGLITSAKSATKRDLGMNNQDVLDYANKHATKVEEAYNVSVSCHKEFKGLKGRELGGMFWILSEIDRHAALVFFGALGTGEMLAKDSPIYVLRQRLMDDLMSKKKFPMMDKLAWVVIAWNHFRNEKTIKQLKWNGDVFPKPE